MANSSNNQLAVAGNTAVPSPDPSGPRIMIHDFPQYSKLYPEVKMMILKSYIRSRPQWITLQGRKAKKNYQRPGFHYRFWCDHEVFIETLGYTYPALLAVNKFTRAYALEFYKPARLNPFLSTPLFINFESAVISFKDNRTFPLFHGPLCAQYRPCPESCTCIDREESLKVLHEKVQYTTINRDTSTWSDYPNDLINLAALKSVFWWTRLPHQSAVNKATAWKSHYLEKYGQDRDFNFVLMDEPAFDKVFTPPKRVIKERTLKMDHKYVEARAKLAERRFQEKMAVFADETK